MTTAGLEVEGITHEGMRQARRAIESYYAMDATDGLPVVPPTEQLLAEFLAQTKRDPDEVLTRQDHLYRDCTVKLAAINAILAGCRPEYFPIVVAAIDAFNESASFRMGVLQSTTGQSALIVVNGPIRNQLEFNYRQGVFGPGFRANATIGRAIRLIIMNVFGVRPGEFDQAPQGQPTKYGFCFPENEEASPWEPLHVERGFAPEQSTVTAFLIRSIMHVEQRHMQDPDQIMATIADSMAYGGGIDPGHGLEVHRPGNGGSTAVLGPEHAMHAANKGWTKQNVKESLWQHFGRTAGELRRIGKPWGVENEPDDTFIHFASSPDSINVIVSGGNNCGISSVIIGSREPIATKPIE